MTRWPEAWCFAFILHALLLLVPLAPRAFVGDPPAPTPLLELSLVDDSTATPQAPPPRDAMADTLPPGATTPPVEVPPTARSVDSPPALAREDPAEGEPEPEVLEEAPPETAHFVRADPDPPPVVDVDAEAISDRNMRAARPTRRAVSTVRIGPPTDGDPSATDVAGASPVPDTVSMPRQEVAENDIPLQLNRDDPSRPGARSGGRQERSRAEAPEAPEVGAPGGQAVERVASKGDRAEPASGAREAGEAGDSAPTRDGLALAIDGEHPAPATGGADPGDPDRVGPDRASRSRDAVRPLLSPGTLDWIVPAEAADGGQARNAAADSDVLSPRAGDGETGQGQARVGDGTATAESSPGRPRQVRGSRAAAGGTGSARLDRAPVVPEETELDVASAMSARETPLGRYAAGIDQLLRDAWDPPLEVKVLTGYGVTTVRFVVDGRGRVVDKELVRQSGVAGLDEAALAAIPARVARPSADIAPQRGVISVTYTFRHSSPIVSRSASR